MAVPERDPERYSRDREPYGDEGPVDRGVRRETRLEPVERERSVREVQVLEAGPTLRWGPIWAGLFASFALLLVLGLVGIAIGLTTLQNTAPGADQVSTASTIWGAVTALISFFVGGWIAGRTTGRPETGVSGLIVGSILWALGVTLAVLLTAIGIGGIAGTALALFGVPNVAPSPGGVGALQAAVIGTLIGLVLSYLASVAGAIMGVNSAPRASGIRS